MPRCKVVATVVLALALALVLASCSESSNSVDKEKVGAKQHMLEDAYGLGIKAHESMVKYKFDNGDNECKKHYAATMANDLGSDAMVDLGREYFVHGCRGEPAPTQVAQGP